MSENLHNFQRNRTPVDAKQALWLRHRESTDLLLLPAKSTQKARKRKTTTVAGRILTREMLEQTPPPKRTAKNKQKTPTNK
ncbi:LOW QUALITY PROTEIN: hypothetical protein PHMEG_00014468 [Phytophthora megakarya]|uniref:Uncharacterized protein n=1 Tax=Phytophthora megakarya TaxID=4795 RepID=A0A225W489_9STRA|nr:LOW QUALITY PROTEIN: hypothetical protein PHMEG_00014468 [Phytophthora megakarya]